MLPLGLKISWFILSLTGLLGCWVTLWSFGRVVGVKWASTLYCVGTTFAQGFFCLGIIYRMDPFLMASSFCLLQNFFMSAGEFINMGVVLAFTLATSTAVRKPKTWGDAHRTLQWQKSFCLPVVVVPLLATVLYLAFFFSFGSARPSDGLWCDSVEPMWIGMFGSSGTPVLFSMPILFLSIQSCFRIRRINLHLLRSRPEFAIPPTLTHSLSGARSQQRRITCRKNSRMSLRDITMIPVTLALTISRKSTAWKGQWMKNAASESAVEGNGISTNSKTGPQSWRESLSLHATRTLTPSFPPTPLPLALLRSNESSESSPNGSAIVLGDLAIGGHAARSPLGVQDITLESRQRHSAFPFQDGKLGSSLRNWNSSHCSTFPTLANDEAPVALSSDSRSTRGTSTKDRDLTNGERCTTGTPAGLFDRDRAAEVDMPVESACLKLDGKHPTLRPIDRVSHSVSADESQDDGEKSDLSFVGDVESALPVINSEGIQDFFMDQKSSISSVAQKRLPSAMIYTLNGPYKKPKRQPAWLAPALWHIILFQFAFVFIQFLAFLTTFVDMATGRRTPSPFGSKNIALLLAAWCPVVIFGSLPVVRRNLIPWRPISIS